MPAPIVIFLAWVGTKAVTSIASAAVSKLVSIPVDKALGIEIQGATVGAWAETAALAIFAGGSLTPEPTFEQKVSARFRELQSQVDELRQDLTDLKKEMVSFQWQVKSLFNASDEEKLWKDMLSLDHTVDSFYDDLQALGASDAPLADRRAAAGTLATNISSSLKPFVANTQMWFLGEDVGAGDERVKGFLEIWRQQALRDADLGWDPARLTRIYVLLESKFTRALLIQVKCLRLLMEAHETLHQKDPSRKGRLDFFANTYYPVLRAEVEGFRDLIESLAINLIPLPTGQMLPLHIPEHIAGMLARLDMFTGQALSGKVADGPPPPESRPLPGVPALAGCWGRVVVPGTRWIRRAPGSKEPARVRLTGEGGRQVTLQGTLEVRAVKYTPYQTKDGPTLHSGYQIQVGNEPRDMDRMLVAHFTPTDVLPRDLSGELEVKLEDQTGDVLAQTRGYVVPIPLDEAQTTTAPYGTFMMSFTGGAGVRGR
jgi:hypothetical protein